MRRTVAVSTAGYQPQERKRICQYVCMCSTCSTCVCAVYACSACACACVCKCTTRRACSLALFYFLYSLSSISFNSQARLVASRLSLSAPPLLGVWCRTAHTTTTGPHHRWTTHPRRPRHPPRTHTPLNTPPGPCMGAPSPHDRTPNAQMAPNGSKWPREAPSCGGGAVVGWLYRYRAGTASHARMPPPGRYFFCRGENGLGRGAPASPAQPLSTSPAPFQHSLAALWQHSADV